MLNWFTRSIRDLRKGKIKLDKEFKFSGRDYLQIFVLPNVYFHAVTAYNILRHNGVEIGKMDFLGVPK